MELNYFDLVVGGIVLLLGLKGILNGFFKEVFGLVGIIGGVFVASRFANEAGTYISNMVFHFDNQSAINFTGFLVVLAGFWAVMVVVGALFKKLVSASGLGIFDKILGFVFGASKFFLIGSIIVYAIYNMKTLRENLKKPMEGSILFPVMVETGGFIMKLDPVDHIKELQSHQDELQSDLTKAIKDKVSDAVENGVDAVKDSVDAEALKEKAQQMIQEHTDAIQEQTTEPTPHESESTDTENVEH